MSSTTTIGLRKLLCCVYEAEIARREATIQRCAELALQDGERGRDLSADDLSMLQKLSDGRVSRDATTAAVAITVVIVAPTESALRIACRRRM